MKVNDVSLAYVSYATAVLMKELGFDYPVVSSYCPVPSRYCICNIDNCDHTNFSEGTLANYNTHSGTVSAPTLALAQKWLLDKYSYHITITSITQESWSRRITKAYQRLSDGNYAEDFYTYDEALEDAINFILKNI